MVITSENADNLGLKVENAGTSGIYITKGIIEPHGTKMADGSSEMEFTDVKIQNIIRTKGATKHENLQ